MFRHNKGDKAIREKKPFSTYGKIPSEAAFFCFGQIVSVELERELKTKKDVFKQEFVLQKDA